MNMIQSFTYTHIHGTYIQKCFIYRHFIKTTVVCDVTEKQINDETKCKLNQTAKQWLWEQVWFQMLLENMKCSNCWLRDYYALPDSTPHKSRQPAVRARAVITRLFHCVGQLTTLYLSNSLQSTEIVSNFQKHNLNKQILKKKTLIGWNSLDCFIILFYRKGWKQISKFKGLYTFENYSVNNNLHGRKYSNFG